jgi:hypothetical protein
MHFLPCGVCLGNAGARLAQPKAQLPEQTLALPNPQVDPIFPLNPGGQRLSVPEIASQACLSRHMAQNGVDLLELLRAQSPGPPGPLALQQSGQAHFLKLMHPVLYRPGSVSQQLRHLRAGHSLRHKQHAVESMVIAGFFRAPDLILQAENNGGRVRDAKWSHASMRSQFLDMRNYF